MLSLMYTYYVIVIGLKAVNIATQPIATITFVYIFFLLSHSKKRIHV